MFSSGSGGTEIINIIDAVTVFPANAVTKILVSPIETPTATALVATEDTTIGKFYINGKLVNDRSRSVYLPLLTVIEIKCNKQYCFTATDCFIFKVK